MGNKRCYRFLFCLGLCLAAMPDVSAQVASPTNSTPPSTEMPAGVVLSSPAPEPVAPVQAKSLFFTTEEMLRIRNAINIFTTHAPKDSIADMTTELQKKSNHDQLYYIYPQFFLESLIYHASNNWVVEINGQRISSDPSTVAKARAPNTVLTNDAVFQQILASGVLPPDASSPLKVISIDKDKATFEWKPLSTDKMGPMKNIGSQPIEVDSKTNLVTFTLRPNQTFSAFSMRILEGKVQPVVVNMAADDAVPPEPVAHAPAPVNNTAPSPAPAQEKTGMEGLLDVYKDTQKNQQQIENKNP